jgi:hypothetical protein
MSTPFEMRVFSVHGAGGYMRFCRLLGSFDARF